MKGLFISNELTEARIIRALDTANTAFDPDAGAEREQTPWLSVNLDMLCFNHDWLVCSRSFLENL